MRPLALVIALVASLLAPGIPAARAASLDLPVRTADSPVPAPCYRGDVLELRLAPAAARLAVPSGAGPTRGRPVGRLGVARVDAVAYSVGAVAFEPLFRGETAPASPDETDFTAFHLVHLAPGSDLSSALDALRALPEVASADPIAILPVSALPADSLVFATWWLYKDQAARTDIRAPEAWAVEPGDTSIVVGILDTGVVPFHPDLGGRGGSERGVMFANWAERAGLPGVDDDGNGYVDDVAGWDFVVNGTLAATGEDARNEDNDPNDWGGHGTACAGIVGAIPGNGIGLAGVVPNVRIMPLRMGWLQSGGLPPAGTVDMSYAAAAIRYATRMGVRVLNCSWQSQNTGGLDAAVTAATRAGVVLVNASGNFGTGFTYLGQRDDVIAVTATDSTDAVWNNAVRGTWVDLAAGGVSMTTTMFARLSATDSLAGRTPAYRGFVNGTSFAAPQVAGAVALLQAQRLRAGLDPLTPLGANLRVRETADDIAALNPLYPNHGTGRLNLFRALTDPVRSLAVRTAGRALGGPLAWRDDRGVSRVLMALNDRSLLALDGASGDTLWTRTLPTTVAGPMAMAQLPPPIAGVVIACATNTGVVHLLSEDGLPMPGWPRTAAAGVNLTGGVVLADLDGDGVHEVVTSGFSTSQARVWAWRADGTPVAGFPFDPGVIGASAVAAADLDGVPGDEVAFVDGASALRVVRADGSELPGFPAPALTGARAPVIARLGRAGTPPSVLVASSGLLTAFAPDGATQWSAPLTGNPAQDVALADLDGDGVDEAVLAVAGPNSLVVRDSSGAAFTGRTGWPVALASTPIGPPVVGPLKPGGEPCVAVQLATGLAVFDSNGQPVRGFPRPGAAGAAPFLAQLDGDDGTEVAAGTTADSLAVVYDAGAGTHDATRMAWPAPRGGVTRSASHALGAPAPFVVDRTPPGRIVDLVASSVTNTSAVVRFTHTGSDGAVGTATRLVLRSAAGPIVDVAGFLAAQVHPPLVPRPAGTPDSVLVSGLAEGSTRWFALRAFDAVGLGSEVSNTDSVTLQGLAPARVNDVRVLAVAESSVVLAWTATGDDGSVGRPRGYRVAASPEALDDAGFEAAPVQRFAEARYDAGAGETLSVDGLTPGRRWRFAVKAVDRAFAESPLSNVPEAVTPVGGALRGRGVLAVASRPMPATADVTFDWQGDPAAGGEQWLLVHDLSGRLVRRIALGREPGGTVNWNGRDEGSRPVPAGLYFVRLVSGSRHADSRVVFVR
ncbi:MAG: S8 family serine peptidase [bacterium]